MDTDFVEKPRSIDAGISTGWSPTSPNFNFAGHLEPSDGDLPLRTIKFLCRGSAVPSTDGICDGTGVDPDITGKRNNGLSSQRLKRLVWEASVSSLKSKRIRGGHHIDDSQDHQDLVSDHVRETDASSKDCYLGTFGCEQLKEIIPSDPTNVGESRTPADGRLSSHYSTDVVPDGNSPRIMFMNILDDAKKTYLTKIIEDLGGSVTCNGAHSTHVITGKARRTLNFCVALCSGAWIVSPHWLKASCREGKFLDESPFVLQDEDYLPKYKVELKDAIMRAKLSPHSLFRGYKICLAKHIQPSAEILSPIIKAAGGSVIRRLLGTRDPSMVIFLACEEDMEDAMVAVKKGVWTFSSDWLMNCVMKQELDLEAPQFAESL